MIKAQRIFLLSSKMISIYVMLLIGVSSEYAISISSIICCIIFFWVRKKKG